LSEDITSQFSDEDCAIVFTQTEDEAKRYDGFGFHLLTPAKYEENPELNLPMNAVFATAVAVFLSNQDNVDMIMEQFNQKANEAQASEDLNGKSGN